MADRSSNVYPWGWYDKLRTIAYIKLAQTPIRSTAQTAIALRINH